ncbi:hypothetical protein PIB30_039511 [Stylosanthes scabra]|uniref:GRF-type domain-containing protein n=1 Tax=Stylosanthes scabra TaxID=79078 RepID=A0ABU6QEY7_9FABA|nr:hypothetical protein [Stylosanthes scabra]
MASQSSVSSQSRRLDVHSRGLFCEHRDKAVLRVVKTKENPGRKFWGCVHYEKGVGAVFLLGRMQSWDRKTQRLQG